MTAVYHKDRVYFFDENNTYAKSGLLKIKDSTLRNIESFNERFTLREINGRILAVCTNKFDVYSVQDSILTLLAKNSSRKFVERPSIFKRRDSLFMMAKSALNNFKNSLYYFDFTQNTWTAFRHEKSHEYVADLNYFETLDFKENLFLYGGLKPDASIPFKVNPNNTLCVYDFERNKWKLKSIHNLSSLGSKASTKEEWAIFLDKTTGDVSLLNFEDNAVYIEPMNAVFGSMKPHHMTIKDKNTLLAFSEIPSPQLNVIDLKKAFLSDKKDFPIYINEGYIFPRALILLALTLGVTAIILIRKRVKNVQKLVFNGEKLWFGQKFIALCVEHQKMMQFMLRRKTLETGDIVDLFSGKNYSVSHTHKLKNDLVRDLQQIILNLTDRDDILIVEKSQEDSRMSVYRLDLNQFDQGTLQAYSAKRGQINNHQKKEEE
jgi:hypothetical protein